MPRPRKRHHSRSRSRSRSHSHERRDDKHRKESYEKDRDGKRRKIESYDSPHYKRSVSSSDTDENISQENIEVPIIGDEKTKMQVVVIVQNSEEVKEKLEELEDQNESDEENMDVSQDSLLNISIQSVEDPMSKVKNDEITTEKILSPKQLQRKLEWEKKRDMRQKEKEERERKRQEEKEERLKLKQKQIEEKQKQLEEKQKEKEMKEEQKRKEKEEREEQKRKEKEFKEEQRRKEKEEKEQKRKEKEEKEEQKRKEREQEKIKRQQEIDEKNKEKQKQVEQKQKAAAAFVNFFVSKKSDSSMTEEKKVDEDVHQLAFMPFEVKSDMKLPPQRREPLSEQERDSLIESLEENNVNASYLSDLKTGKTIGKSFKTWPYVDSSEDVEIVEEQSDLGETICEDTNKMTKLRAKYLLFHENRRPPYYGTWSKKSAFVKARKPFGEDKKVFDYEVDSDDDWEEEEQGESLNGSDDEDKDNDVENEDYEVDNEFFVPHGHLSDDEVDDEANAKLSPESLKQKLKLLKDEFDLDIKSKTHKLKPRSIGCIWYNKAGDNVDKAIDRYLQPLAVITDGQIIIGSRDIIERKRKSKKKSAKVEA